LRLEPRVRRRIMRPVEIGSYYFFMTPQPKPSTESFFGLGIAPKLLEILEKNHFETPTPIQTKAIPIGVEGNDLVGIAQTGTGKTLAFAIPMIQRLAATKGRGLVLLPTRELAIQVSETFEKIGRGIHLQSAVLIGGASMGPQIRAVKNDPHVIVATPGRLIDHLNQGTVKLNRVNILVLDEADRMLDMGFAPQIKRILETIPKERQTMLFSATMPGEIARLAAGYMKLPVRIEVAPSGTASERVEQELFVVQKNDKVRLLEKLLGEYHGTVLVFSRTKHGARKICRSLKHMEHSAAEIHSDRSLSQRRDALEGFKNGKYRVLVATDIAARGIDVKGIELVVNFDLPDQAEDYVHRIGRTGRAGQAGKAISFAMPDQGRDVRDIEKLIRLPLRITPLPELPPARTMSETADVDREAYPRHRRQGQSKGRAGYGQRPAHSSSERRRRTPNF